MSQDVSGKDITSELIPKTNCKAVIKVNENCVLAGVEEATYLFREHELKVKVHKNDGTHANKKSKIITIIGSAQKILTIERISLNILGRMSGVATICAEAKKKSKNTKLAVTRKTIPGFQAFDKKAAEIAGVWSHRKNLNEMILLKDNHLKFIGIKEGIAKAKKTGKKIEIEVENEKEALEAAREKPNFIMLDNFSQKNAKKTIKKLREKGFNGKIELSGGITIKNLPKYSNLGADLISMGELTKKAKIIDFSMDVIK